MYLLGPVGLHPRAGGRACGRAEPLGLPGGRARARARTSARPGDRGMGVRTYGRAAKPPRSCRKAPKPLSTHRNLFK